MSWLTQTLTSSIGKKVLMSLTGLFLCLFLVVHLIGNLQLFKDDGGYAFNTYAVMMTTFAPIKIISYLNYFYSLSCVLGYLPRGFQPQGEECEVQRDQEPVHLVEP